YKDRVYNVVYRFLGNREDALDVAQEVFIRAYGSIGAYQGRAQVFTWLYTIAANLARNRIRDSKRKGRNQGSSLEALHES
ncbi:MAG: sigma-70 family RNA polymerase sigma factor, partial [Candidatus Hydrogenedentes bacterium]|nr:sigma-70 family RNA polymerase sigma factor [Candidatus Hydrogenedentota bacterium]